MAINLVHGTIETVDVTVTDVTGVVTTLDGLTPTYTVIPVDPTTDEDKPDTFLIYDAEAALNSGMLMQCLLDTTAGATTIVTPGIRAFCLATNAASLPITVVASVNDEFVVEGQTFQIAPGTYSTLTSLIAAMEVATNILDGITTLLSSYGVYVLSDGGGGKILFTYPTVGVLHNGSTIFNTGANDVLLETGFTNAQASNGGTDDSIVVGPWTVGKYRMYVSFSYSSDVPKLGPIDFYVV